MPSDEVLIDAAIYAEDEWGSRGDCGPEMDTYYREKAAEPFRKMIRAAVERALSPWMQAVGLATTFAGSVEVNPDDPVGMMKEVGRALAAQEARHKREVIEARIDEAVNSTPSAARIALLRAELAALEGGKP